MFRDHPKTNKKYTPPFTGKGCPLLRCVPSRNQSPGVQTAGLIRTKANLFYQMIEKQCQRAFRLEQQQKEIGVFKTFSAGRRNPKPLLSAAIQQPAKRLDSELKRAGLIAVIKDAEPCLCYCFFCFFFVFSTVVNCEVSFLVCQSFSHFSKVDCVPFFVCLAFVIGTYLTSSSLTFSFKLLFLLFRAFQSLLVPEGCKNGLIFKCQFCA